MGRLEIGAALTILFAVGLAVVILRWMRSAEQAIETGSEQALEAVSSLADNIGLGGNGVSDELGTGAKSVRDQLP